MSSVLKLAQRLPRRLAFNRIYAYSHRTIVTFANSHVHSSPITAASGAHHHHHHHSHDCGCTHCHGRRSLSTQAQDKDNEASEQEQENANEDVESSEAEESDNEHSQQIADLELKVDEMEKELKKYKDALARSHADIMNIQNMNKKDVENARKFATKSFSKDMLNVADSLQGCLSVVEQQQEGGEAVSSEHIKSVIDGVRVTHSTLMDTFGRHDIKRIESLNVEFDPNFHEALFKMPTDEFPPDTVCQVVSEGYTIKDAVLRAAKVGVATAPPTPAPTESAATEDGEEKKE